ncbi:hypothetical protein ACJ41O_010623 [Fusarium nematophilum]
MTRRSRRVKELRDRAALNSSKVAKAPRTTRAKPPSTSRKKLRMASDDDSGTPPRDASPPQNASPRTGADAAAMKPSQDTVPSGKDNRGPSLMELVNESLRLEASGFLEKLDAADKRSLVTYSELRGATHPDDIGRLSVQEEWELFVTGVAVFASDSFKDIPWDSLDKAAQETLTSLNPNAETLLKMAGGSALMFRSWIWRIIIDNFFAGKSADIEWTSPFWEAYGCLETYFSGKSLVLEAKSLEESMKTGLIRRAEGGLPRGRPDIVHKYPFWRYITMQLHYTATCPSERREPERGGPKLRIKPECVGRIIAKEIGPNFPKDLSPWANGSLDKLAKCIALFDYTFSATFTSFDLVLCHPKTAEASGFAFDPDLEGYGPNAMIAEDPCPGPLQGRPVDLVFEPMLVVRGGVDEIDYSLLDVLWPMRVCVDWVGEFERQFNKAEDGAADEGAAD